MTFWIPRNLYANMNSNLAEDIYVNSLSQLDEDDEVPDIEETYQYQESCKESTS